MSKLIPLISGLALTLITSVAFAKKDKAEGTVEILHKPDGPAVIIRINKNALAAHAAHGDCVFDNSDEPPQEERNGDVDIPFCEDQDDPPA
ncbi:MAG: hypothetical protein RL120_14230 [Gammaproteobacteria bacterium]